MMSQQQIPKEVKDKAKSLYLKACNLETEGKPMEAVELYKQAFKLYPKLEKDGLEGSDSDDDNNDNHDKHYESETTLMKKAGLDEKTFKLETLLERFTTVERKSVPEHYRTFDARKLSSLDTDDNDQEAIKAKQYLESEGYVVFDNCLNETEIKESLVHFENFLNAAITDKLPDQNNVDNETTTTSVINNANALVMSRIANPANGIVTKYGAGHSSFNWFIRSRENVKKAFKSVIFDQHQSKQKEEQKEQEQEQEQKKKNKLITSFDGFNFIINEEAHNEGGGVDASWLHFDASGSLTGNRYYQGLVNLLDQTPHTEPSFVVFPKSHRKVFPHLLPGPGNNPEDGASIHFLNKKNFLKMADPALQIVEKPFRVPMKPGSLVIWKSSTLHCSIGCSDRAEEMKNPKQVFRRIASYVCMMAMPEDNNNKNEKDDDEDDKQESIEELRLRNFKYGITCGHQPDFLRASSGPASSTMKELGVVIVDEKKLPEGAHELL